MPSVRDLYYVLCMECSNTLRRKIGNSSVCNTLIWNNVRAALVGTTVLADDTEVALLLLLLMMVVVFFACPARTQSMPPLMCD